MKKQRPSDPALEAMKASLVAAYRESKAEELDWPRSAWGDLQAVRKALADDDEVLRRWRAFLATSPFWPIKSVHKFREAFSHARFQVKASEPVSLIPTFRG